MRHIGLVVLLCVSLHVLGEPAFAQGAEPDRRQLLVQRKELAKKYLIAAGIQPPEQLDLAHLPQLRAEFGKWLGEPPQQPVSATNQGTDAAGSGLKNVSDPTLKYLIPSSWNRFLRLPQFKADALEQTKTVFIQNPDQLKPVPARNPDDILWKYSLSFNFSELSLSSADLATIYGSYGKFAGDGKKPALAVGDGQECKDPSNLMACLRRTRSQDFFWRAVSGFTATLSYGQSPRVQQNILISSDTSVGKALHLYSGQVDFDPKSLFPSGTDWDNATKSLEVFKIGRKSALGSPCAGHVNCLKHLSAPSAKWGMVSALVPTFTFKVQTQFDFIKTTGGEFIRPPFPESHLWSLAFTTDLRRAIPSIKARADALSALKMLNAPPDPSHSDNCTMDIPDPIAGSLYSYSLDSDTSDLSWEFQKGSCTPMQDRATPFKKAECEINGLVLKGNGNLMGYPRIPRQETLTVIATARDGKQAKCDVHFKIKAGEQNTGTTQLWLDYVDIALSADILLDDKWFVEFSRTASRVLGDMKWARHDSNSSDMER